VKKIVLVLFLVAFVCAGGFGLDVSVGAKGAAGFSGFAGKDYTDLLDSFGGKRAFFLGFGGGVFATLGLLDLLAIQPEVLLLRVGGADKEPSNNKENFIVPYVAPAVLVKARFDMFNVFAGPMLMIKISSGRYEYRDAGGSLIGEFDFTDDALSNLVFAATGGVGIQYPIGPGSLVGELRGYYAFTGFFNPDLATDVWNLFGAMVMVGYSIQLL
jgi:hypothetical protein